MAIITADVVNSTLTINGRTIEDVAEGDSFVVAFANDATSQTDGVNNSRVIKKRNDKDNGSITLNVLRYSEDDAFLQNIVNGEDITVIDGSLKTPYTRDSVDGTETYTITNASVQSRADDTKNNTDGDDIASYVIFGTIVRTV